MAGFLSSAKDVAEGAFKKWREHKATRMAAALAYFGILSIAPLTVLMVAIAGFVYGRQAAEGLLLDRLSSSLGSDAAELLQSAIASIYERGGGLLASIMAVIIVLVGASGLIGNLRDTLNTVWEVEPRSAKGPLWALLTKLLDVGVAIAAGVFLLGTMLANTALTAMIDIFSERLPAPAAVIQGMGLLVSFALIVLFLMFVFRVLPHVSLSWGDVWLGAVVTGLLFLLGNLGVSFYLAKASPGSAFGAAGSLVVMMIWIYYSALIILFGAELTRTLALRRRRLLTWARGKGLTGRKRLPAPPADHAGSSPG